MTPHVSDFIDNNIENHTSMGYAFKKAWGDDFKIIHFYCNQCKNRFDLKKYQTVAQVICPKCKSIKLRKLEGRGS